MSTIIQFPLDEKARLEFKHSILNRKAKHKKKKSIPIQATYITMNIPGIYDIQHNLEQLNDTMKYVTDGLYSISIELKDIRKKIADVDGTIKKALSFVKKSMFFSILLFIWFLKSKYF